MQIKRLLLALSFPIVAASIVYVQNGGNYKVKTLSHKMPEKKLSSTKNIEIEYIKTQVSKKKVATLAVVQEKIEEVKEEAIQRTVDYNIYGGHTVFSYLNENEYTTELFNADGVLRERGSFKDSKLNGEWALFNDEGIKRRENLYDNGVKTNERLFNSEGNQLLEISFNEGVRLSEEGFKNGRSSYQLIFNYDEDGSTLDKISGFKYDERGSEIALSQNEIYQYSKLNSKYNKNYVQEPATDIEHVISDKDFCVSIKNTQYSKEVRLDYYNYECDKVLDTPYT